MVDVRFITVTGTGPGAGKTSLACALVDTSVAQGRPVLYIDEDAVWGKRQLGWDPVAYDDAWPEFHSLHQGGRDATTTDDVLDAFDNVRKRLGPVDAWVQDWSWIDLAAMSSGSISTDGSLSAFSQRLLAAAQDLNPVVLYLSADVERCLNRATAERGSVWLYRHAGVLPSHDSPDREQLVQSLVTMYSGAEKRRLGLLRNAGWNTVILDARGSMSTVLAAALEALDEAHL